MKRILVIDDDNAVRKAFALALEDTPYKLDGAESGEKGIEMEQNNKYNLIFLDLKMPGLNGVETLRELRKISKDTPVYIVTAFYKEFFEGLKVASDDGLDFELLKKPIGGDEIVLVARSVLEGPEKY
ncbi:MAG TPA: response regulator [Desulfobacterales bacterium]|nr:response regulator [Desulfobacterales bacterium]